MDSLSRLQFLSTKLPVQDRFSATCISTHSRPGSLQKKESEEFAEDKHAGGQNGTRIGTRSYMIDARK